ncbi:uncharacterized protein N7483_011322 [Penicillium malachiteum]|uniref:uncharacterized protein n=1 Tax=Penicillium malachiteum TaxID=1324776 RepID=UPI002546A01B|nr:uncharacterized protein N7483_011322 [Penicillium malachiteum]KAJ5714141.1 hypothetical protein N7483_011322 [Penicillium malachiteum]
MRNYGFSKPKASSWSYANKASIAVASILGTLTFFGIVFLAVWCIKRARARRLRKIRNESQDLFCQSTLTLTDDTSKTLDTFLMEDVQPERTSLMFSRSRSPSFTFVVEESNRQSPVNGLYRASYDASSNNISKLDSLTTVSTDISLPSMMVSPLTQTTSNNSDKPTSPICLSRASTVTTSPRSSALWVTTSASSTNTASTASRSMESSSIFGSQEPVSSRTSQFAPSSNILLSPASSLVRSTTSNTSGASPSSNILPSPASSLVRSTMSTTSGAPSRYAGYNARHSAPPLGHPPPAGSRRVQVMSHRQSPSAVQSPMQLSSNNSGQSSQV